MTSQQISVRVVANLAPIDRIRYIKHEQNSHRCFKCRFAIEFGEWNSLPFSLMTPTHFGEFPWHLKIYRMVRRTYNWKKVFRQNLMSETSNQFKKANKGNLTICPWHFQVFPDYLKIPIISRFSQCSLTKATLNLPRSSLRFFLRQLNLKWRRYLLILLNFSENLFFWENPFGGGILVILKWDFFGPQSWTKR